MKIDRNESGGLDETPEAKSVAADSAVADPEAAYENYRKGFELIYKQLLDNLAKLGVERVEPLGQRFDPHLHQAVDRTETDDAEDGEILQVFQPGYVFHGRVLRPAMVRVAVHATPASKRTVN